MKFYRAHIAVLCIIALAALTDAHNALNNALTDLRFHWFPRQATDEIVLIEIDPRSIEEIGVWPWPRSLHANLIDKLHRAGVSEIAFDIDFSSPSRPDLDAAFLQALKKARGSVILPSFKQLIRDKHGAVSIHKSFPLPEFGKQSWPATVNVTTEPGGLVRRYPYGERLEGAFYPSVGALLAGEYETNQKEFLIDFSIRPDTVPRLSYIDILRGDADQRLLSGKKVIIGGTAIELGDRFNVPNYGMIPGSLLQVLAANSIMQERALHNSANLVTLSGLGLLFFAMIIFWPRTTAKSRTLLLGGFALAAESGAAAVQASLPIILDTALWHAAILGYVIAIAADEIDLRGLVARISEKRFHRIAMSLADGLVCTDQSGAITVWNPAAEAIFGYAPHEIMGQPLVVLFADRNRDLPVEDFLQSISAKDVPLYSGGKAIEIEGIRKNGETFPLEASFSRWPGMNGFQYGVVIRDISARKREEQRIRYLAEYDTLTGLANRYTLHERLKEKLHEAQSKQQEVSLILIDLDKFKEINDTLGHSYGDKVLCAVAEKLVEIADEVDIIARLGGDEFAILIGGPDTANRSEKLAGQVLHALNDSPVAAGECRFELTASAGIAIYPRDAQSHDDLLANADLALYRAKAKGRSQHIFFHSDIRDTFETQLLLERELRQAIEKDEFELFYQPQFDLKTTRLVGAEALARWRHPQRGLVSPVEFMPTVNASSISNDVAFSIMRMACSQGQSWERQGHAVRIGVNLSPSQFQSGDLAAAVAKILAETGLSPDLLELEVTEDILLHDVNAARETFRRINELGVHLAFDDFGTGYASLTYLKQFQLDRLKVDSSFVREMQAGSADAAIVGSTIGLSKLLGLSVIAEGIQDQATVEILLDMGCAEGQGYYFGRPVPASEFERMFFADPRLCGDQLLAGQGA